MTVKKNPNIEIQQINRSNIYQHFFESEHLTKQNIVSDLQLCLPTVTKNIDDLLQNKLIQISGSRGHTGGRRATTYSLIKDAKIALGIDITLNHITIVAVDLTGNIITSIRQRITFETTPQYYQYVADILADLIAQNRFTNEQILGVGIGLPALVDIDRKSILFSKIIQIDNRIFDEFSKYIPYPIQLFNDANAAAYTETWKNPTIQNAFYLMLSNNIGGSMVINGSVYHGDSQKSGEIGHISLVTNGKPCYCGQNGCVDAYLAATNLSNHTNGNLELFFEKMQEGNESLTQVWHEYLNHLASTVNILHILLDCNVILGGYVGGYIEPFISELRDYTGKLDTFSQHGNYLQLCSYKKESIAAGAALNFISEFINSI